MQKLLAAAALVLALTGCGGASPAGKPDAVEPEAPAAEETPAPAPAATWSCIALPEGESDDFRELAGVDVREVVARADGRAVLAGAIQGDPASAALLLLDAEGRPDASGACGAGWQVVTAGSGFITGIGLAAHADGSVTVAAFGDLDGGAATFLATADANLAPRSTARFPDRAEAFTAAADGSLFLAGGELAPWIVKLSSDGTRDASFGTVDCAAWGGCTSNERIERLAPVDGGVAAAFGSDTQLRVRRIAANGSVGSTWTHSVTEGVAHTIDAFSADAGTLAVSGCAESSPRECEAISVDAIGTERELGRGVDALALANGSVFGMSARADGDGGVFLEHEDGAFVPASDVDVGPELGVAAMALARTPAASIGLLSGLEAEWTGEEWTYVHRNFVLVDR